MAEAHTDISDDQSLFFIPFKCIGIPRRIVVSVLRKIAHQYVLNSQAFTYIRILLDPYRIIRTAVVAKLLDIFVLGLQCLLVITRRNLISKYYFRSINHINLLRVGTSFYS